MTFFHHFTDDLCVERTEVQSYSVARMVLSNLVWDRAFKAFQNFSRLLTECRCIKGQPR